MVLRRQPHLHAQPPQAGRRATSVWATDRERAALLSPAYSCVAMRFKVEDLDVDFPYPRIYPEQYQYMLELKRWALVG